MNQRDRRVRQHPPNSEVVTDYDHPCFKLYIMPIGAEASDIKWHDILTMALGLKISDDRSKAYRQYLTHRRRDK